MRHTVLVVEDEVELRETMCEALEVSGYVVVAAKDGKEALIKISGIESLCLVILDLLMPVMNGWDFVEQLRQRSEFATVPIIVHSSSPGPAPATVARVLKKPISFDQLVATVREYCHAVAVLLIVGVTAPG